MVALRRKLALPPDRGYRQNVGRRSRILHGPSGVPRRHDTGDPEAFRFLDFLFHQLRTLLTAQAEVDHVNLLLDAQIQGINEIAEAALGKDLVGIDLGIRSNAANANGIVQIASNDASRMGAVSQGVLRPGGIALRERVVPPFDLDRKSTRLNSS